MVEKRKIEAMAANCRGARGGIGSSSKEEENYESDISDETVQIKPMMTKTHLF